MFKFNFEVNGDSESAFSSATEKEENTKPVEELPKIEWYESKQVLPNIEKVEELDIYRLNATDKVLGEVTLSYAVSGFLLDDVTNDIAEENTEQEDIVKAEQKHSDLLPGIYEGGAKIWECTDDLLQYMNEKFSREYWPNKRVLDLGCGSGLLGIYAFKCGAFVHFQDYNVDVLDKITIPNVLLNVEVPESVSTEQFAELFLFVKFYSGDWKKYAQLTHLEQKFDLILSCETIYNPENQKKLLDTFDVRLNEEGEILVAAKTHYFGVGGGLRQFEGIIAEDKRFKSEVVFCTQTDGVGREILLLTRTKS